MQYILSLLIALWQTDWNFEDKSFFLCENHSFLLISSWFILITAVKCLLKRKIFSEKRLEFQSCCVYRGFEIYTSYMDLFHGAFVAFLKLEISSPNSLKLHKKAHYSKFLLCVRMTPGSFSIVRIFNYFSIIANNLFRFSHIQGHNHHIIKG